MPLFTSKDDLSALVGAAEINKWALNSDARVNVALEKAEDALRSAVTNTFTLASYDALTSSTMPQLALSHLWWYAIDDLAAGKAAPESIATKAEEARNFFARVAANKERCFDEVLTFLGASGVDSVRVGPDPVNRFDFTDTESQIYLVDPSIY